MVYGVIPARYGAQRLPGKPLIKILDKPLIQWVIEGVSSSRLLDKVIVATDHQDIAKIAENAGVEAVMTDSDLPSGSDRVWAAVTNRDCDVVVNIQGDEPLMDGALVDLVVEPLLANEEIPMSTAAVPLTPEDLGNKDVVKVVLNQNSDAIYFSRFPIPYSRGDASSGSALAWRHLGIYGYRKSFLQQFCQQAATELERAESLEQLRAMYLGKPIRVVTTEHDSYGVDTPEDVKKIEEILRKREQHGG